MQCVTIDIHCRKFDAEARALPLELHLGTMEGDDKLDLDCLAREKCPSRFDLGMKNTLYESSLDRLHWAVHGADEIVPEIGDDTAERVGDAGSRRNEDARDRKLAR